jgi:hypothetical protein
MIAGLTFCRFSSFSFVLYCGYVPSRINRECEVKYVIQDTRLGLQLSIEFWIFVCCFLGGNSCRPNFT